MCSSSHLTSQPTKALYPFPDRLESLEVLTPGYYQYLLEYLLLPCVIGELKRHDQPQILESGQRRLRRTTLPQRRQPFLGAEDRYITFLGKQPSASLARLATGSRIRHRPPPAPVSIPGSQKRSPRFLTAIPAYPKSQSLVDHSRSSRLSLMDGGFGGHAKYEHHDLGSLQDNTMGVFQEGDIREFMGASEKLLIR